MKQILFATSLLVGGLVSSAAADAQSYTAKFTQVSNNCNNMGLTLADGTVRIDVQKSSVIVSVDKLPTMKGVPGKAGAVRAESTLGPTTLPGLDGKFSAAGRAAEGTLQLILVVEFFGKGKALCTQSWDVTGQAQR